MDLSSTLEIRYNIMEHVIRKLFASTVVVRTQRTLSQEEIIAFHFGPSLKQTQHKHDNVDPKAPAADQPPKDPPGLPSKTEENPSPQR